MVSLTQVSEGLASTQKEKLASLAESVEFESEEEYREKLETLKESYFSKSQLQLLKLKHSQRDVDSTTAESTTGSMAAYLKISQCFQAKTEFNIKSNCKQSPLGKSQMFQSESSAGKVGTSPGL